MKKFSPFLLLTSLILSFYTPPASAQAVSADATPNIIVAKTKALCPTATYTTIQSAVNAARPGDIIRVCAGTYDEQVVIQTQLVLQADNGVVVKPAAVSANATGPTGDPIAAIILAENSLNVQLQGFIVDGSANGIMDCSPRLIGILYQDASGIVSHNEVRHMRLVSSLDGCQSGNAIEVESSGSGHASVTITSNTVDTYQKNGITANESGTQVSINENTVTGVGPTVGAAQNGIQIGFGAQGTITSNSIANNVYSPCNSPTNCPANAAGILIYQSDGIHMQHNVLGVNQVGIFVAANNAVVGSSTIFHSVALDGIALVGNGNTANGNDVSNSDEAAVFIQGNNNTVSNNDLTGATVGILKLSGSTGTVESGNLFFATLTTVIDPAPSRNFTPMPSR
ncbi:MAG: right-handed parallel beta-helix repeat-containing protein [Candidatus Acidiferrales bacterium]